MPALSSSRGQHCIEDFYDIHSRLTDHSCGAGGTVVRGIRRSDGVAFAVKICELGSSREDKSQIQTLTQVNHPGIIKLVDWFETPTTLYVVMELAMGGEMFARIVERGRFTERQAAAAFKQILEAVGHMHDRGLVHCDLKPENILYEDDSDRQIKIADFGFAQFMPDAVEGGHLSKQLGTLNYTAPEILSGAGYDTKADMWSLGVILYILLSGIPPFGKTRNETDRQHRNKILTCTYRFYQSHFSSVSADATDLIKRLIVLDPNVRLGYHEALEHPWIRGNAPDTQLPGEYILEIGTFNSRRGMYRLASHALAGLVTRFARPDVIGAISADTNSLSRVLQEGSIQPIVSLAYSNSPDDRKNACNAMANLALNEDYQGKLILEGGVRRLNQLACKDQAEAGDIKFFTAMALARIAKNAELRERLLESGVNADARLNTLVALLHLAAPPHSSRISRQATEALALLGTEESLHDRLVCGPARIAGTVPPTVNAELVAWGVLLPLVRQSQPSVPMTFRKTALEALRCIAAAAVQQPRAEGAVQPAVLQERLSALFDFAQTLRSSEDLERPWRRKLGDELMGGLAVLVGTLRREPGLLEALSDDGAAPPQPWHDAQDHTGPVDVPDLPPLGDAPPAFERTWSQRFDALDRDLPTFRAHLLSAHKLLNEVAGRPLPARHSSWMDLSDMATDADAAAAAAALAAGSAAGGGEEEDQDMADAPTHDAVLSDADKRRLDECRSRLMLDRSSLITKIVKITAGENQTPRRGTIPAAVNAVLTEMTDIILVLSDLVDRHL